MKPQQGTTTTTVEVESANPLAELLAKPHTASAATATLHNDLPEIRRVVKAYCDRQKMKWVLEFEGGTMELVSRAVIRKVEFACKVINGQRVGCGSDQEYRGFCHGTFDPMEKVNTRKSRRLYFDRSYGAFCDSETGEEFFDASVLILMPDCHARYVPTKK